MSQHLRLMTMENHSLRLFNAKLWEHLQAERRLFNEMHARALERRDATIRGLQLRLASTSPVGVRQSVEADTEEALT